jgi:hypothetical protein
LDGAGSGITVLPEFITGMSGQSVIRRELFGHKSSDLTIETTFLVDRCEFVEFRSGIPQVLQPFGSKVCSLRISLGAH